MLANFQRVQIKWFARVVSYLVNVALMDYGSLIQTRCFVRNAELKIPTASEITSLIFINKATRNRWPQELVD